MAHALELSLARQQLAEQRLCPLDGIVQEKRASVGEYLRRARRGEYLKRIPCG